MRAVWLIPGAVLVAFAYWLGFHQPIREPQAVPGITNGLYAVADVAALTPGRYLSAGAEGSAPCLWERLSGPTPHRDVIEAGRADSRQLTWVTVQTGDRYFWSSGCQPWRKAER